MLCIGCVCLPKDNKMLETIGDGYWLCMNWYKHHFGEDTRNWFILLMIRESVEVIVQIIAIFNFNGYNIFSPNQLVLALSESEIKLFTIILCLNCILVGILWIFYVCGYKLCHGEFFKQLVFVVDTIFDTFYALFPIIIVINQNNKKFNLMVAVGSLQSTNMYVHLYLFSCAFV